MRLTPRNNGDLIKIDIAEKYKEQQEEIAIKKRDERRTRTGHQGKRKNEEKKDPGSENSHESGIQD